MRYPVVVGSLLALSAGVAGLGDDGWRDTDWAVEPEKTAEWYTKNGFFVPDVAPAITTVKANKSYVVKLECVGCPFRVRELYQVVEYWQEPPQDNSLLLNFTIDDSEPAHPVLLLNGHRVAPLDPMPVAISAFQTPANLSDWVMNNMVRQHMLDSSWVLGTKYGQFELQYEHTIVGTRGFGENWLQFDITAIHQRSVHNPDSYKLGSESQKIVQILLRQQPGRIELKIQDIQLVERKDRAKPYKMNCGKYAMIKSEFNPLEWDYYGQFGTWTRAWHLVLWKTGHFFDANGLNLIILAVVVGVVTLLRRRLRRQQAKALAQAQGDTEAALLASEYEAPPEYQDVPKLEEEEEKS